MKDDGLLVPRGILPEDTRVPWVKKWRRFIVSSEQIQAGVQKSTTAIFSIHRALLRKSYMLSSEWVGQVDSRECFIFANPALEHIFWVSSGGLIGKTVFDFLADKNESEVIVAETGARLAWKSSAYSLAIVRQNDGELRKIRVLATPQYDEKGGYYATEGRVEDITHSQQSIEQSLHVAEVTRIKNLILNAAHVCTDLDSFYAHLHEILLESHLFPVKEFSVGILDKIHDEIVFEYVCDSVDPRFRVIREASESGSLSMQIIREDRPILLSGEDFERFPNRIGSASQAFMGVPLAVDGRAYGVLMTQDYEGKIHFTEEQYHDFQEIAKSISVALESKRAESRQQRTAHWRDEMMNISHSIGTAPDLHGFCRDLHASIMRLMDNDALSKSFYVALLPVGMKYEEISPDTEIEYVYYRDVKDSIEGDSIVEPLWRGLTSRLLRQRSMLHLTVEEKEVLVSNREIERIGPDSFDWLGAPLMIDDQIIGAIVVQSYDAGAMYDRSHEELLCYVAYQMAFAVEKKRHEDLLAAQKRELEHLYANLNELTLQQGIGYAIIGHDETILQVNEPFCDLLGMPEQQLLGKSLFDFIPSEEDRERICQGTERRRQGIRDTYEIVISDANGMEKTIRISGAPRTNEFGVVVSEAFFQDTSRIRELEMRLKMDSTLNVMGANEARNGLKTLVALLQREQIIAGDSVEWLESGIVIGFIDVDYLKLANDEWWKHLSWDRLLRDAVRALKIAFHRESDLLARWWGDEFLIILRHCLLSQAKGVIANRLDSAVKEVNRQRMSEYGNYLRKYIEAWDPHERINEFVPLSLSIGFHEIINRTSSHRAQWTRIPAGDPTEVAEMLTKCADKVMYGNKYKKRWLDALHAGMTKVAAGFFSLALAEDPGNRELQSLLRTTWSGVAFSENDARNQSSAICRYISEEMLRNENPEVFVLLVQARALEATANTLGWMLWDEVFRHHSFVVKGRIFLIGEQLFYEGRQVRIVKHEHGNVILADIHDERIEVSQEVFCRRAPCVFSGFSLMPWQLVWYRQKPHRIVGFMNGEVQLQSTDTKRVQFSLSQATAYKSLVFDVYGKRFWMQKEVSYLDKTCRIVGNENWQIQLQAENGTRFSVSPETLFLRAEEA